MTLFGLHVPYSLFIADPDGVRDRATAAALASVDRVLAEPIAGCLLTDAAGRPCIDVATPVDLERDLALPQGNIFHTPVEWPWAEPDDPRGRWGVGTAYRDVLLCGSGALRGGAVSGIPGRSAAMALLAP
jgi:phytoene dehydrogenase-like protein